MAYKKGDKVTVNGRPYYTSYGGAPGAELKGYTGTITHVNDRENVPYPIHIDTKGWFPVSNIEKQEQTKTERINAQVNTAVAESVAEKKKLARRVELSLIFQGNNISQDLNRYLISCTYTDNSENNADDLNITIDDREGQWLKWLQADTLLNVKGAEISCVIVYKNYNDTGKEKVLDCGTFEVDTVNIDGPPQKLTFKASAIAAKNKIRVEKKTKAWEGYSLNGIAAEIAANAGMDLMYESGYVPSYVRQEQNNISDILFLKTLCNNAGISIKITSKTIVLYDQAEYEQKAAIYEIDRTKGGFISYSFSTSTNDTSYEKCHVTYTDQKTKKKIEATYTVPNAKEDGQILEIKDVKVSSKEEALKVAEKRLRQKNKGEYEASLSLPGNPDLVAGVNITLKGFGPFDGKYIINKATHSITGGYKTEVNATRVMEGY